jgi:hypothetical protein
VPKTPQQRLPASARKAQAQWFADVKRDPERQKDIRRRLNMLKRQPTPSEILGIVRPDISRSVDRAAADVTQRRQAASARRTERYLYGSFNRPDIEARVRLGQTRTAIKSQRDIDRLLARGKDKSLPLSQRRAALSTLSGRYDVPMAGEEIQRLRRQQIMAAGGRPEGSHYGTFNLGVVHLPTGAIAAAGLKELQGTGVLSRIAATSAKGYEGAFKSLGIAGTAPGKFALHAIQDAVNLPAQVAPSLYLPGRAAVKAIGGDSSELHDMLQSYKNTGVLPALFTGHLGEAASHFMAHPVYSALELRGLKAGVGRGAGFAMRTAGKLPSLDEAALREAAFGKGAPKPGARGSGRDVTAYIKAMEQAASGARRQGIHQTPRGFRERLYAAADTGRRDLGYYGAVAQTGRSYSKDVLGKAFQRGYEKLEGRRGIDPFESRRTLFAQATGRHTGGRSQGTSALFNARVAAWEAMRKEGRAAGLEEVASVLGDVRGEGGSALGGTKLISKTAPDSLELAPWIVKRIVRSPKTWKADLEHEIARLEKVRTETGKGGRTGFERRVGEADQRGKTLYAESKKAVAAHEKTVETLKRLRDSLDEGGVQQAFKIAGDFDEWSRRTRKQLIDRGVLLPDQAEFAPLMPYAVSHMGAKWKGGKAEGHLTVDGKTELTAQHIRAHMAEHAPEVGAAPTPETVRPKSQAPDELRVPPGEVTSPVFTALKKAEAEAEAARTALADRHNPATEADNPRQGYLHPGKHAEQIGDLAPGESIHVNERVSIRRQGTPELHLDVLPEKPIPKQGLTTAEAAVRLHDVRWKDMKEWRDNLAAGERDLAAARKAGDIERAQHIDTLLEEHRREGDDLWEPHPEERALVEQALEQSRKGKLSGEKRARQAQERRDLAAREKAAKKVEPSKAKTGDQILWHGEWKPIKSIEGGKAFIDRGNNKTAEVKLSQKDVQVRRLPDEVPKTEPRPVYEVYDGDKKISTHYKTGTAAKKATDYAEKNPPQGLREAPPIDVTPEGAVRTPAGPEPVRAAETPPASPESRTMLSEEMKRYLDPGFISEGEHFGSGAFYVPMRRNQTRAKLVRGRRTGEAFRLGYAPTDPEAMLQEIVRTRGVMDSVDAFDQMIRDFSVRAPNGKFWRTTKEAEHWLHDTDTGEALSRRLGDEFVPVRVADVATARDNLKQIKQRALPEAQAGVEKNEFFRGRTEAMKSTGSGAVVLMPQHLVKLLDAHLAPTTGITKIVERASQEFKGTVLPFSPKWFVGNVVDTIGLRAIASYGLINPYEYRLGYKIARDLARQDPKAARMLRSLGLGGTHIGSTMDLMKRRTSSEVDGAGHTLLKHTEAFFAHPVPATFGTAFRSLQRALFSANRWFESQPQYAALGRHARDLMKEQTGSIRVSKAAYDDVLHGLKNTQAQEAFGRKVQTMFGRWGALSPGEKSTMIHYAPFYSWMRNSAKFVFVTLPRDHPVKVGMLAIATDMSDEERKAMGLDWFVTENRQPTWRQGLLPVGWSEGSTEGGVRVQNFTSFGPYADPGVFLSNQALPWASGLLDTMGGVNWKNQPIKNPDGTDLDPVQRGALAFYLEAEAVIPLLRMARTGVEGGAPPLDTSTLFTPRTREGEAKSPLKALRRWGDPFQRVRTSTATKSSGAWGTGAGAWGGSSGGFKVPSGGWGG